LYSRCLAGAAAAAATLNGLEYRDEGGFDLLRSRDKDWGEGIEATLQDGSISQKVKQNQGTHERSVNYGRSILNKERALEDDQS
jgi:hypothetical protein